MAGLKEEFVDNVLLFHQVVLNDHGAFFLLLPLFCGLTTLLLYLLLQTFSWNSNTYFGDRRKACQLKSKLPYPPEKDEQLHFVEQISKHAVRIQRQRSGGLGDNSVTGQWKLGNCEKEDNNLQKEQLEVYAFEKKIAELSRVKAEKIEGFQRKEGNRMENMSELQERLDKLVLDYEFEKRLREKYEKDLERSFTENDTYKKVIERFWNLREQIVGPCDAEKNQKRAAILLQESEGLWSYGETNKILYDQAAQAKANLAIAQEELKAYAASLENLQAQFKKDNCARSKVEDSLSHFKKQLSCYVEFIELELKQLNADKTTLKHDIAQLSMENKSSIAALLEACKELENKKQTLNMENKSQIIDNGAAEQANEEVPTKERKCSTRTENDEALAQALHEKVAALLQLSQQEGQHLLEVDNTLALQSEISSLKNELMQVTSEKVKALLELAWLQGEFLKLQENSKLRPEKTWRHSSDQWSPVSDHGVFFEDDDSLTSYMSESPKEPPQTQVNPKTLWTKGSVESVNQTRSLSSVLSLNRSKDIDVGRIQRLFAENASLRDSLRGIRHLCQSANRLRLTIARVAAETGVQTESAVQLAIEAVDGVISEALHLKVALHSSLPVDDLGWNSIGSPLSGPNEFGDREFFDGQMNDDLDIVSFFGVEIVRLVLLAAQLQKRFLGQNV